MNPDSKQRIIGIIVLLILIGLLIPFLFMGEKKQSLLSDPESFHPITELIDSQPAQTTAGEEGKPKSATEQYLVDGKDTVVGDGSKELSNTNEENDITIDMLTAEPETPKDSSSLEIEPSKPNKSTVPKKSTVQKTEAVTKQNIQPKQASDTKTQPKFNITKSTTAPTPQKTTSVSSNANHQPNKIKRPSAKTPTWSVQVGSFAKPTNMQRMVNKLQSKGFDVYLQKITTSQGEMVRVLVGQVATQAQAKQLLQRLKAQKIEGLIIGN